MEDPYVTVLLLGKKPLSTTRSHLAEVRAIWPTLHAKRHQFCHILYPDLYDAAPGKHLTICGSFLFRSTDILIRVGCNYLPRPGVQFRCPRILHSSYENSRDMLRRLAHAGDSGSDRFIKTGFLRRYAASFRVEAQFPIRQSLGTLPSQSTYGCALPSALESNPIQSALQPAPGNPSDFGWC